MINDCYTEGMQKTLKPNESKEQTIDIIKQ